IVVGRDAVVAVAIVVEPDGVKRRFGRFPGAARGLGKHRWDVGRAETVRRHKARDVDVAVVHPAAFALPWYALAKRVKPGRSDVRIHECRDVDDPAGFVVDERLPPVAEESELGQG
ncbi:MAG: hypothetical protein WBX26_00775, partial [Candidatus Cybelea sp.]